MLRPFEMPKLLRAAIADRWRIRARTCHTPDAWLKEDATKIGYEVSFTRNFYKPQALPTLDEIGTDIVAIEKKVEGLLDGLLEGGPR